MPQRLIVLNMEACFRTPEKDSLIVSSNFCKKGFGKIFLGLVLCGYNFEAGPDSTNVAAGFIHRVRHEYTIAENAAYIYGSLAHRHPARILLMPRKNLALVALGCRF